MRTNGTNRREADTLSFGSVCFFFTYGCLEQERDLMQENVRLRRLSQSRVGRNAIESSNSYNKIESA